MDRTKWRIKPCESVLVFAILLSIYNSYYVTESKKEVKKT